MTFKHPRSTFSVRTLALALALLFYAALADASFEKATKIYSMGQFEEARVAFQTMAAIGDPSSLFNLGVMYYRGEAVDRDPVKGYVLMKVANEVVNDESFSRTMQSIFSKFDDVQKKKSVELYQELVLIYGVDNIKASIFPRLLDDKDCPPDLEPIKRGMPIYPRSELRSGRMGLVNAEFTVSPEGYAREVHVTSSTSKDFSQATFVALDDYLYPPSLNQKPKSERHITIYRIDSDASQVRTAKFVKQMNDLKEKSESGDVLSQFLYARTLNTYRHFKGFFKGRDFQYREANEWFTRSASAGVVNAQFEIGRNMLEGRGCEVDKVNGFKWVKAAAVGGHSPAQRYLATAEINDIAIADNKSSSIVNWLRNAAQDDIRGFPSKVLLAWELVASPEKSILNPDEALDLINKPPNTFNDDIRIAETKAAAYALKNNYKKAIKFQSKALKLAEKKNWEIPKISERLQLYKQSQVYVGSYY